MGIDETELLRSCLQVRYGPRRDAALAERTRGLDTDGWESLRVHSEAERLAPLLHDAVAGRVAVPAVSLAALQRARRATGLRNLVLQRELARCLSALDGAGLAAIVLKGAALAEAVYGDVSLRPMGDIDLLVRRGDLVAASATLHELGYESVRAETHPGTLAEYENELLFRKRGRVDTDLDVHWSLFDSPYYQSRLAMEWFWETAAPLAAAGPAALMLGPEALLLHLCGHLELHHYGRGLLWTYDIVEVVHRYRDRIDWDTLVTRARMYELARPVGAALRAAAVDWGAPVPSEAVDALAAHRQSRAEGRAIAAMASGRPPGRRFWGDLAGMGGWRRRLRFARTHLFPSAAYMRRRYRISHRLLLPIYYPYRWLRGLRGLR